ncbi:MAG: TonB-dependent receptor [Candidatus Thiodiazotropha sp.]
MNSPLINTTYATRPHRTALFKIRAALISLILTCLPVFADDSNDAHELERLKSLSIDDLLELTVTSATRKAQPLSNAASAIYVITQEDIRRSGVSQLPELLRMVPGLHVAKIDSSKWAISARGFNGRYANKLLVLMDGRSLYTPLYSGVYWDVQDTVLEDIERIEVIRGPGATLWGANAVNGVINIITKSSMNTDGGLLSVSGGNNEPGSATIRISGNTDNDSRYRAYLKTFRRNGAVFFDGGEAEDHWDGERLGFRSDSIISEADHFTIQGDLYNGSAGQNNFSPFPPPSGSMEKDTAETSGGNLITRWTRRLSTDSNMSLQLYYDRTNRKNATLREGRDTFDLDFQNDFLFGERHAIVWGAGYRTSRDEVRSPSTSVLTLGHTTNRDNIISAFIQDDIGLVGDRLNLILGAKFERNDYTGSELQPNIRMIWTPDEFSTYWAAASRAVRTPSRIETDVNIQIGPIFVSGNSEFDAEKLLAYELGYRTQAIPNFSLDIATFYNEYDDLTTFELLPPPFPGSTLIRLDNRMSGKSYGLELVANWAVTDHWQIKMSHAWLQVDLQNDSTSNDTTSAETTDITPEHQTQLRSQLDLPHQIEFDTSLYYVDKIPNSDITGYTRLDMRLGWRPSPSLEVALSLQNLLDDKHPEFIEFSGFAGPIGLKSTQVERSALLQLEWKF